MAGAGNRQEFGETLDDAEDEGMQDLDGVGHDVGSGIKKARRGDAPADYTQRRGYASGNSARTGTFSADARTSIASSDGLAPPVSMRDM